MLDIQSKHALALQTALETQKAADADCDGVISAAKCAFSVSVGQRRTDMQGGRHYLSSLQHGGEVASDHAAKGDLYDGMAVSGAIPCRLGMRARSAIIEVAHQPLPAAIAARR